jgi:hypothetical protein
MLLTYAQYKSLRALTRRIHRALPRLPPHIIESRLEWELYREKETSTLGCRKK